MLIAIAALAAVLAVAGHIAAGRLTGLSITIFCSAAMAFFLMPPRFSLRVSESRDVLVLSLYGCVGLVTAKATRSRPKQKAVSADCIREFCPTRPSPVETDLSRILGELMSSELEAVLEPIIIAGSGEGFTVPCSSEETHRLLADALAFALQTRGIQRISINGGQRPGIRRVIVAAHLVWPTPQGRVITMGKRDEDCELVVFPGWPSHWRACWFENGL